MKNETLHSVFLVVHIRSDEADNEDVKILGVFSSIKKARASIIAAMGKPGFSSYPEGFQIHETEPDKVNWPCGLSL